MSIDTLCLSGAHYPGYQYFVFIKYMDLGYRWLAIEALELTAAAPMKDNFVILPHVKGVMYVTELR